jgi:hypothetical protein
VILRRETQSGISLVGVLIAMGILLAGIAWILNAKKIFDDQEVISDQRISAQSVQHALATQIADRIAEFMRTGPGNNCSATTNEFKGAVLGGWALPHGANLVRVGDFAGQVLGGQAITQLGQPMLDGAKRCNGLQTFPDGSDPAEDDTVDRLPGTTRRIFACFSIPKIPDGVEDRPEQGSFLYGDPKFIEFSLTFLNLVTYQTVDCSAWTALPADGTRGAMAAWTIHWRTLAGGNPSYKRITGQKTFRSQP